MTSHILNKCGSSLHCGWAWAYALSDFQLDQMTCCIGHNCKPFHCCGLPCASSEFLIDQMTSGILNKCESCLHCGLPCASSDVRLDQTTSGIRNIYESCLHCWWGNDSPSHFAWAWTTQHRADFQTERSETFPRLCRHFYFSMFRV